MILRELKLSDVEDWRAMVDDYDPDIKDNWVHAWTKFCDEKSPSQGLVAEATGVVVGFINYVIHEHLWTEQPVCYLSDLYVKPEHRRVGYGRAMIEQLIEIAVDKGVARVYWITHKDNEARKLYDALAKTDWIRYHINLVDFV